jgi:hypothetical protein
MRMRLSRRRPVVRTHARKTIFAATGLVFAFAPATAIPAPTLGSQTGEGGGAAGPAVVHAHAAAVSKRKPKRKRGHGKRTTWRFGFPKLGNAGDPRVFRDSPRGSVNFGGPLPSEGGVYPLDRIQVVRGGVHGAPRALNPSGRVVRLEVTPGGPQHAKLYKYVDFAEGASGTYEAAYWLPRNFAIRQNYTAVNVFQFKNGAGMNSGNSSFRVSVSLMPASWAGVRHPSGRSDAPVAVIRHDNDWGAAGREHGNNAFHGPQKPRPVPLGRPVRIRANVKVGKRIDFFVNGRRLGTLRNSHVPFSGVPGFSRSLIFGIGHYSPDPGYLYILDAAFTRR